MSRSCPPLKRDVSPITKTGRNISHDRNHKQAQIFVLSKLKESLQSEGNGSKRCPGKKVDDLHDEPSIIADPLFLWKSRLYKMTLIVLIRKRSWLTWLPSLNKKKPRKIKKGERGSLTPHTSGVAACFKAHQEKIISLGEKFLRRMDSTMCFLIVAFRMLSKANWTRSMISIDVKQAAHWQRMVC